MFRFADGKAVPTTCSFQDIDREGRIEQKLIKNENMVREAGRLAKMGIWEIDLVLGQHIGIIQDLTESKSVKELASRNEAMLSDTQQLIHSDSWETNIANGQNYI